jgi:hypothetical protein
MFAQTFFILESLLYDEAITSWKKKKPHRVVEA